MGVFDRQWHTRKSFPKLFSITWPLGNLWVFITSWWRPLSDLFTYGPQRDICCFTSAITPELPPCLNGLFGYEPGASTCTTRSQRRGRKGATQTLLMVPHSLQVQSIGSMQVYCNHIMGNQIALSRHPISIHSPSLFHSHCLPLSISLSLSLTPSLPLSLSPSLSIFSLSPLCPVMGIHIPEIARVCSCSKWAFMNRLRSLNCH